MNKNIYSNWRAKVRKTIVTSYLFDNNDLRFYSLFTLNIKLLKSFILEQIHW